MSSRRQRSTPLGDRYRQVSLYLHWRKDDSFRWRGHGNRAISIDCECCTIPRGYDVVPGTIIDAGRVGCTEILTASVKSWANVVQIDHVPHKTGLNKIPA